MAFGGITGLFLLVTIIAIYFVPTFVAGNHKNKGAIFALNLLLGWTLLGWVAALVWALTGNGPDPALASSKQGELAEAETKACPYCAEKIKAAAIVCRYCNREISSPTP